MSKSGRMLMKLLLIIIGFIVIGYIFAVSFRIGKREQPEGEYISVQDAQILMEALLEKNAEHTEGTANLTYGEFLILTKDMPETEKIAEYRRVYQTKYEENFFFLKEDWYLFFEELLVCCDMQDSIVPVTVRILGAGEEVSEEGAVLSQNQLLTMEGVLFYQSDLFSEYKYQVISAYQKEDTLLTVQKVIGRGLSLSNIWVMEANQESLQIFYDLYEIRIPYAEAEASQREQIADLEFADGRLQSVKGKTDKISGKLLSIGEKELEIEGHGRYPYKEGWKVYRLFGRLAQCDRKELRIGYGFADFVLEDGQICAALITREEAMENIRVVIKNTDFAGAYHETVELTADTDFSLRYGKYGEEQNKEYAAGEKLFLDGESEFFSGDRIYIEPAALTGKIQLLSVNRAQGAPCFRGKIEIERTKEGLVVVNEVLLEEYLYSVVPSEMPASYPMEALKAQAVCARTYAYRHMLHSGIAGFGAHVDDSAGYQVYNNISENAQTTKAVKETSGQLLYYGEELCGSYYYSTSCGYGTDTDIWKGESKEDTSYLAAERVGEEKNYSGEELQDEDAFADFISRKHDTDYEKEEAWYRWSYHSDRMDEEKMLLALQKRFEVNPQLVLTETSDKEFESLPVKKLGAVKDILIVKRNEGGVADELLIIGEKNTYKVISEHNIRYVLNNGESKVIRQDGSEIAVPTLLPSAFFTITTGKEDEVVVGYTITGGGYGHGVGMSQNGARAMANRGFLTEDILHFFYQSCEIRNAY